MNDKKLAELRQGLETRLHDLRGDIDRMSEEIRSIGIEEGIEGGVGNHLADDGSNVMEGERLATIREDVKGILLQVEAALARMDDGTFGVCQRCHQKIGSERLEAFPYVAYCIDCQAIIEREHLLRTGR